MVLPVTRRYTCVARGGIVDEDRVDIDQRRWTGMVLGGGYATQLVTARALDQDEFRAPRETIVQGRSRILVCQ